MKRRRSDLDWLGRCEVSTRTTLSDVMQGLLKLIASSDVTLVVTQQRRRAIGS